jgi:hypothetical protein
MGFTNNEGTMKTIAVEIRGTSPLLIHRFGEDAEQSKATRRVEVEAEERADLKAEMARRGIE